MEDNRNTLYQMVSNQMPDDEKLRLDIVSMTRFSLDEAYFAYQFVKGNDNALSELKEFRKWKKERDERDGNVMYGA